MSGNWLLSAWRATGTATRQCAQPREGAPGPACAEKASWLLGDDRRRAREPGRQGGSPGGCPRPEPPRFSAADRGPPRRARGREGCQPAGHAREPSAVPSTTIARGQRATHPLCSAWVQALADACAALSTGGVPKSRRVGGAGPGLGGGKGGPGGSSRILKGAIPAFLRRRWLYSRLTFPRSGKGGRPAKAPRAEGSQRLTPPPPMAPPIRHPQQFSPEPGEIDCSFLLFTCSRGWSCP